jgi:hypothetical protein
MHSEITNSETTTSGAISSTGASTATISTVSQDIRARRQPGPGVIRYGLPCANCRLYYAAELTACPICSCGDRISPLTDLVRSAAML